MKLLVLMMTGIGMGMSAAAFGAASPTLLVENGQARVTVNVAPGAPEGLQAAVADLTRCLRQMSGATLEVREYRPGARGIVVGSVKELADFPGQAQLAALGPEGLLIRSEGDRLWLVGNTSLGAQQAVYTLLDKLGCRWYFPGSAWEVIPSSATVHVGPWDEVQRPSFDARRIWYGFGLGSPAIRRDYEEWVRRNRLGGSLDGNIGHAWEAIVPKELFAEHPDWFAEVGGVRKPGKLCTTNPAVVQRAIDYARQEFRTHPEMRMVSVSPSDGLGFCECARCAAVGTTSDQVFTLTNRVAAALRDEFPDKLIGCYAYSAYSAVPKIALEPNVYVQVAAGYIRAGVPVEELVEGWGAKARQIGIREYYSVWQWDWDHPDKGRGNDWAYLRHTLPYYYQHHATSINGESSNNWGAKGVGYYLASRLMWDVKSDPDAVLRDFFQHAFEGAAPAMERYFRRWSSAPFGAPLYESRDMPAVFKGWQPGPKLTPESLALSFRDLNEATAQAKSPAVQARIDLMRMYLHFLKLSLDYDAALQGEQGERAAEAMVRFAARIMDTSMIHAQPLLAKSPERRLKGMPKERVAAVMPEWSKRGTPPEHAEMEKLWAADWDALKSHLPSK